MKVPFLDLHRQYLSIRDEIDSAIRSVMVDSAFVGGRNNSFVTRFEEEWAAYLGAKYVVGCANGTDALEITLEAMGIGPSHEVIVPAMTWISTAGAVARVGAKPVFVDVDPIYYTMDAALIENEITDRTRAIIPVHLYGLPAEMDTINDIARRHNLLVIEDAAQAHGAVYKGRKAGTLADAAIFSFYPGKNLGALGDAGCIVTDDGAFAEEVRRIGNHGQVEKHDFRRLGRNSRLDGIHAAVLSAKLPHLNDWIDRRRDVAELYGSLLSKVNVALPSVRNESMHAFHLYVILGGIINDRRGAFEAAPVSFGRHYPATMDSLGVFSTNRDLSRFPNARLVADAGLSLPIFPEISEDELYRVVSSIKEAVV